MKTDNTYRSQWPFTHDPHREADVMLGIYPDKAKTMVVENPRRSTRRSTWAMNIAGPFCFLRNSSAEAVASQVSNLTALPVVVKTTRKVVFINVLLSQGEKDVLISNEYRRQIKHAA